MHYCFERSFVTFLTHFHYFCYFCILMTLWPTHKTPIIFSDPHPHSDFGPSYTFSLQRRNPFHTVYWHLQSVRANHESQDNNIQTTTTFLKQLQLRNHAFNPIHGTFLHWLLEKSEMWPCHFRSRLNKLRHLGQPARQCHYAILCTNFPESSSLLEGMLCLPGILHFSAEENSWRRRLEVNSLVLLFKK